MVAQTQTPPELRWDDARTFLALWREGSLKRAAVELGVNISTVSRRLEGLEQALGARLFDRTPEGTLPTAAATHLAPFAEGMEQAALGFAHGLEGFEVEPEGTVRLAAPPGLIDHFLAGSLPQLLARHPGLRIEMPSSIHYADLARREADLALRLVRPTTGDLVAKLLVGSGWGIYASPDHVEAIGKLRRADQTTWVGWGEELLHLADAMWLDARVPPERVLLRSNGMTGLIEAARAGMGAIILPTPYARLDGIVEVPCTAALRRDLADLPEAQLWLVGHRAHRRIPRIAAVWDWLVDMFDEVSTTSTRTVSRAAK